MKTTDIGLKLAPFPL